VVLSGHATPRPRRLFCHHERSQKVYGSPPRRSFLLSTGAVVAAGGLPILFQGLSRRSPSKSRHVSWFTPFPVSVWAFEKEHIHLGSRQAFAPTQGNHGSPSQHQREPTRPPSLLGRRRQGQGWNRNLERVRASDGGAPCLLLLEEPRCRGRSSNRGSNSHNRAWRALLQDVHPEAALAPDSDQEECLGRSPSGGPGRHAGGRRHA